MKTVPLSELQTESGEERARKYLASIPDGHAVSLADTLRDSGITGREKWKELAGDCLIYRYSGKSKTAFLVSPKTAKALAKQSP
jgi:hypothetical protein